MDFQHERKLTSLKLGKKSSEDNVEMPPKRGSLKLAKRESIGVVKQVDGTVFEVFVEETNDDGVPQFKKQMSGKKLMEVQSDSEA